MRRHSTVSHRRRRRCESVITVTTIALATRQRLLGKIGPRLDERISHHDARYHRINSDCTLRKLMPLHHFRSDNSFKTSAQQYMGRKLGAAVPPFWRREGAVPLFRWECWVPI